MAFFGGAAENAIPYLAQSEAKAEENAEAKLTAYKAMSAASPATTYRPAPLAPTATNSTSVWRSAGGGYALGALHHSKAIADERLKQGTLTEVDHAKRIASTERAIEDVAKPLSTLQADFQSFGQVLTDGIRAALEAQSHILQNRIQVELDGRVIAEKVSELQFNFNHRMA